MKSRTAAYQSFSDNIKTDGAENTGSGVGGRNVYRYDRPWVICLAIHPSRKELPDQPAFPEAYVPTAVSCNHRELFSL